MSPRRRNQSRVHLFSEILWEDNHRFTQKSRAEQNCPDPSDPDSEFKMILIRLVQWHVFSEQVDHIVEHPFFAPECHTDPFARKHEQLVSGVSRSIFRVVKRRTGEIHHPQVYYPVHAVLHEPRIDSSGDHEIEL